MQHRANHRAPGHHRRLPALPGHPGTHPGRTRHALLTAAFAAGIAVAAVSAAGQAHAATHTPARAAAPAASAAARAAVDSPPAASAGSPGISAFADDPAEGWPTAAEPDDVEAVVVPPTQPGTIGNLAWATQSRKTRPVPKAVAAGAGAAAAGAARAVVTAWVNPLPEAAVTSCFGERWGRLHAGVDLAAADGTRIRAAGAGTVTAAGPAEGYGNAVLIDHGNGYLTHYGHLSVVTVVAGQHVRAGQQIGAEGSTGHSTGPHLHFEVHQGFYKNPVEPTRWLHEHGVDIPGCVDLG